jgi:hypothetical protein
MSNYHYLQSEKMMEYQHSHGARQLISKSAVKVRDNTL